MLADPMQTGRLMSHMTRCHVMWGAFYCPPHLPAMTGWAPQLVREKTQHLVTPIGAVVTAATGIKKFWPSFLLLDRLTALQMGPWPFDRTHLTTLCAIRTRRTLISWPLLPSLKIVLDCLTDTKNSPWPLDRFLTPVAAVTTAPMGMTTPCHTMHITHFSREMCYGQLM